MLTGLTIPILTILAILYSYLLHVVFVLHVLHVLHVHVQAEGYSIKLQAEMAKWEQQTKRSQQVRRSHQAIPSGDLLRR